MLTLAHIQSLSGAKLRSGSESSNARSLYFLEACCSTKFFEEPTCLKPAVLLQRPRICPGGTACLLYTPNLPKAASEHHSKTQIAVGASRSCGAGMHRSAAEGRFGEAEPAGRASVCARARTLGVNMLSENAFKEMPTLADKSSDFGFSSGIQVYFWTQRPL